MIFQDTDWIESVIVTETVMMTLLLPEKEMMNFFITEVRYTCFLEVVSQAGVWIPH